MKSIKLFVIVIAVLTVSSIAEGRTRFSQEQLDSIAIRLAERIENNAWSLFPTEFNSSNNARVEFIDTRDNHISVAEDNIAIYLNFMGARIVPMASSPHDKGRSLVNAAVAVQRNGSFPNYVKTIGTITEKKVSIGRKSKSVTAKFTYVIEDTNLNLTHSTARVTLYVDTTDSNARLVFYNMNMDGTLYGTITLL